MPYLMIENKGEAPHSAFTVLGASNKASLDIPGLIGTFGSGASLATCTLLRQGINPIVFIGKTRMEFFTEPVVVTDVRKQHSYYEQVCIKFGGTSTKTERLSWTTQYGAYDWTEIPFAMREYVSNAIDAMLMQGVKLQNVWQYFRVEVVENDELRAKSGFTRVFIPLEGHHHQKTVEKFFNQIHCWFLHSEEPELLGKEIIPKNGRNLKRNDDGTANNRAVIYRRGVLVREFSHSNVPSLYDYNFDELKMNESRQLDDWQILNAAGEAIKKASPEVIATVLKANIAKKDVWEATVPAYSLQLNSEDKKNEISHNWQLALKAIGGDNAVVVTGDMAEDQVRRKGFNPIRLSDIFAAAAEVMELKTENKVLTEDDRRNRTFHPMNEALSNTLDRVWKNVVKYKMNNDKEKPKAMLFHEQMEAECERYGYYKDGTVYVHTDYATNENDALDLTVLEEVAHFCSNATDRSLDFQTWLMRFIHIAVLK